MKLLILIFFGLVSCSLFNNNYKKPMMKRLDRELYVIDHGWNLSWRIKTSFINGEIVSGMPQNFVEIIYGGPDLVIQCPLQNLICDEILEYKSNNFYTIGSVSILNDTVVKATKQLSIPCRY